MNKRKSNSKEGKWNKRKKNIKRIKAKRKQINQHKNISMILVKRINRRVKLVIIRIRAIQII